MSLDLAIEHWFCSCLIGPASAGRLGFIFRHQYLACRSSTPSDCSRHHIPTTPITLPGFLRPELFYVVLKRTREPHGPARVCLGCQLPHSTGKRGRYGYCRENFTVYSVS